LKKITIVLTLFIPILFLACTSKPITTSLEPITKEVADIKISLSYIPEIELIKMYKKDGNIFANYPGRVQPKKSIVFQLDISTEESVINFNINDLTLTIGAAFGNSRTQYQLLRAWGPYNNTLLEENKAKKLARTRMFNDEVTVTPDQPVSAWIVFLENFPNQGKGSLSLYLSTEDGDSGSIEIPLEFSADSDSTKLFNKTKKENPSIFDEEEVKENKESIFNEEKDSEESIFN